MTPGAPSCVGSRKHNRAQGGCQQGTNWSLKINFKVSLYLISDEGACAVDGTDGEILGPKLLTGRAGGVGGASPGWPS